MEVLDVADAPHTANQKLRVCLHRCGFDDHPVKTKVGERGFVHVLFVVQRHSDLVDDPVAAFLPDGGLHQF